MAPAVKGKRRCRVHGGAEGSGAPKGNKNALKHGLYTHKALDERRRLRKLMADARKALKELA
jgi:glucans biosynthesis protein